MRRGLRAQLSMTIVFAVLAAIGAISFLSNLFINAEFENYAKAQQEDHAGAIVANLNRQYNSLTKEWNMDYVHGVGMYALYDGYVICVRDSAGGLIWDAENHDMSLCSQVMQEITSRMSERRPNLAGRFVTREYALTQNSQDIGSVSISNYGPYFLKESDFRFLDALNMILIIIGPAALFCALIAGYLLAGRIARPIVKTAHIATQIAEGNYKIRFEGQLKTRELDELAAAVNHMAESLERQENLRKRLTTDVAHELRTPLSAVASHLEMMIEGLWEPTPERLKSCFEEAGRISGLVADLEKLSKIENENLTLQKSQADLLAFAQTVSDHFSSESAKKNIALAVMGEPSAVSFDRDRMTQVLTNLLSNAVKYTPEGGHVRVTVTDAPEYGIFTVEDDGVGIPKEDLPFIFERFYRADKSRNRKTGGAGIGLTIVRSIVEAHGGTVKAENRTEQGSRFIVSLPKFILD